MAGRRYMLKECGGSGICEHGRQKAECKECREVAYVSMAGGIGARSAEAAAYVSMAGEKRRNTAGVQATAVYVGMARQEE
jgi:hypothetical protein